MKRLFKRLGIKPKNESIYIQALTHASFAHENQTGDYERLEFLGDAVIQIMMSDYLFKHDQGDQGVLTKKRAQSVREEALFLYAEKLDLKAYLRLGQGEQNAKQSVIADAFEALFAAIYLDLGLHTAFEVFEKVVIPYLPLVENIKDYKTQLQEYIQLERKKLYYQTVKVSGPSHRPTFKSEVFLEGDILLGSGLGLSKTEAEQNAAQDALSKVVKEVSYVKETL